MFINQLTATNLRSLEFITLTPEKNVNIIIGKNNDGKTTLLEGIYYCSTLKSFKQVSTSMLIKNHSKSLKVLLKYAKSGENTTISIEKNLTGGSINKINDKKASAKQLFINLPVLALNFGSTNIVTTNSDERRSFLDWGVFHVEHNYIDIFKDYQKAVKQRNSLLKKKDRTNLDYWTGIVVERGNLLHSYRESYFNEFNKHFISLQESIRSFMPDVYGDIRDMKLDFIRGWPNNKSLEIAMIESIDKDIIFKHTTCGPHRADISFKSSGIDLKHISSMSTQIITGLLMVLSQASMFHVKHDHNPIVLIDDLFFGIDDKNLKLVINLLVGSNAQFFITAPDLYREQLLSICQSNNKIKTYGFKNKLLVEEKNG